VFLDFRDITRHQGRCAQEVAATFVPREDFMMTLKSLRIFGALLFAVLGCAAQAQITDINSAINKAGRERMLSQRMAKAYFQMGLNVDVERSRAVMDGSIALFDRQLVELKNYAPTPEIKETYQKLERSWLAYKDVLIGSAASQTNGKKVLELSDEVLALAQQGTVQLEQHARSSSARLVNVAGRQRMLSQRLAKFYQAAAWNVGGTQASSEAERTRKEFEEGLQELNGASVNTPAINAELQLLSQQWYFFDSALKQRTSTDRNLQLNVATTSERILQLTENIAGLYEKVLTR
jgi:nitrate/nitrite-specific signal transduction histidine kinase